MLDWALNTSLHMHKLSNNIFICCNAEQLQKGRHNTSFFTHLNGEQRPLQVQLNMYSFRLTSYVPHQSTANLLSLVCFHLQSAGVFDHLVLVSCPIFNQHHKLNVDDEAEKCNVSGEAFSVCFHSNLIRCSYESNYVDHRQHNYIFQSDWDHFISLYLVSSLIEWKFQWCIRSTKYSLICQKTRM